MSHSTETNVQKTQVERPSFLLWRLSLAVGFLRLLRTFGWRVADARGPFGDARNPLVAQALADLPGRVGSGATLSVGFLDPHPPACEQVQVRAVFHDGGRLFEYTAVRTGDHETWRYDPFQGDPAQYNPVLMAEEDGRQGKREFYYRLERTGDGFGVVLRETPPRRFSPEPN